MRSSNVPPLAGAAMAAWTSRLAFSIHRNANFAVVRGPAGLGPRRRSGPALGLCALLLLAGCQTVATADGSPEADPSVPETLVASSNELNRLGRQDLDAGNSGLAERHFREAVEKNSDDASSWIGLAAAYDNLARFELADRAYRQAAALDGETLPIINNRGYSYLLRGDQKQALRQFERALALDPNNVVIRNNIRLLRSGERPTSRAAP